MTKVVTTENPSRDCVRYLRHYADADFNLPLLRAVHSGSSLPKLRRKARDVAFMIRQGLEYLASAEASSLLTRPLPMFYAAENLIKALAVFSDPNLEAGDFRAHGLSGDKARRYSIKNLTCKVGTPGSDVWSQIYQSINGDRLRLTLQEDGSQFVRDFWSQHPTSRPTRGSTLKFGELVKCLPELTQDVIFAGWGNSYVVHIPSYSLAQTTGPPANGTVSFRFRHGHDAATKQMIVSSERKLELLRSYTKITDALDIMEYQQSYTGSIIKGPSLRLDVFGELFGEFKTTGVYGELVIYFASLFILSDVVRYQVELWKRLLEDHPSEALLVERFLEIGGRKLPNLVLNQLAGELYEFKFAR